MEETHEHITIYLIFCNPVVSWMMEYNRNMQFAWSNTSQPNKHWLVHQFITCTPLPNCFSKHCKDVQSGRVGFATLSPSCKSRTSLGTMGRGATELLGLLKGGSHLIWGHYNSTKACGCLHTEWAKNEWPVLTLHTCTDKSIRSAKGQTHREWSPWT